MPALRPVAVDHQEFGRSSRETGFSLSSAGFFSEGAAFRRAIRAIGSPARTNRQGRDNLVQADIQQFAQHSRDFGPSWTRNTTTGCPQAF